MQGFIAYLLILKIALCDGQFEKNICIGDVELTFSTVDRDFNGARSSCRVFEGDLVKIGNAEIQTAIENAVVVKPAYYIGAYDGDGDNVYHWLTDNAGVPENPLLSWPLPSTGYQNWKSNQPNNGPERCVALGIHGVYTWSDVSCNNIYRYVCQRESEKMLTITTSNNIATCVSSDVVDAVRWEKNSVVIQSSNTNQVYQTTASNSATLHLQNANFTEAGTYSCASTTSSCNARKSHEVIIDGTPTIIETQINNCDLSLRVTWKPNQAAIGVNHRIMAFNFTNVTVFEIPRSSDVYVTEIVGLNSSTQYTVDITACTSAESCETGSTARTSVEINGITDPVTTPRLVAGENEDCVVSWDKSDEASSFTVKTQCSLHPIRSVEKVTTSNKTVTTNTMIFQPLPSRRCEAFIQAKGCEKISKLVKAGGVCLTPAKEPDYVEPPTLFKNQNGNVTSHVIEITKPRENNGLISCLFIIICYEKCTYVDFTYEKLKKANGTNDSNLEKDRISIAAALPMSRFLDRQYFLKLSLGNQTYCDVYDIGISNYSSSSNNTFRGQNVAIMNSVNTSMFLVSATPSNGKIVLKSSPVVTMAALKNETKVLEVKSSTETSLVSEKPTSTSAETAENAGNSGLPIGHSIGIAVALIAGFVAGFLVARCRKGKKSAPEQTYTQTENTIDMTPPPQQDTSFYDNENALSDATYDEIKPRNNQINQESDAYVN